MRAGRSEAEAIFALERSMAEAQWTRVEQRDPKRIYNRVELAGLQKLAPRFDWKAYLAAVGIPPTQISASIFRSPCHLPGTTFQWVPGAASPPSTRLPMNILTHSS